MTDADDPLESFDCLEDVLDDCFDDFERDDEPDDTCPECNGRGRDMQGCECDDCYGTGKCDY